MNHEVIADKHTLGSWRVEAIDHDREGICYIAVFHGVDAQIRAGEYAAWKNGDHCEACNALHIHKAKYDGEKLLRECGLCGEDLMHPSHKRGFV